MSLFGTLGPPHTQKSWHEAIHNRQLEEARRAGWPQLEREELVFGRFVEHAPTGDLYQVHRGALLDSIYTATAAYYMSTQGEIVFLERLPGALPQTRAELEQRRAGREQRRNAPRPRKQVKRR